MNKTSKPYTVKLSKKSYLLLPLIIFSLSFFSCERETIAVKTIDESEHLILLDSINLDEKWKYTKFLNVSAFELDSLKYIALFKGYMEKDTTCTISIFSDDGVFKKHIYIDTLADILDERYLKGFQAVNLNKFFFYIDSQLYCLDSDGNLLLNQEVSTIVKECARYGGFVQAKSDFILENGKSLLVSLVDYPLFNRNDSLSERIKTNKEFLKKPKMLFVKNVFADSLEYKFVLQDAFENMLDSADCERIPRWINVHGNNVLSIHEYSDKIKRYNDEFELQQTYTLQLDSFKVGVKPYTLFDKGRIHDTILKRYKESIVIYNAHYDDLSKKLVVFTITKKDKSKQDIPEIFIFNEEGELIEMLNSFNNYRGRAFLHQLKNRFYQVNKENLKIYIYELR